MKQTTLKRIPSLLLAATTSVIVLGSLGACRQVSDVVNTAVSEVHLPSDAQPVADTTAVQALTPKSVYATTEQLANYQWTLIEATMQGAPLQHYQDIITKKSGQLNFFRNNTLSYNLGCNTHFGEYQLALGKLELPHGLSATRMACQDVGEAESRLAKDLNKSLMTLQVYPQHHTAMLLQTHGGLVMRWQGVMKPEVRFGEPVRLYWEVSPEKVACVDEAGNDQLCLKVRHINYDDQGIKTGSGAWRTFDGQIDGFVFDPSVRQIIRLNAFNNPDGKPNPYYVYDTTIESELVSPASH